VKVPNTEKIFRLISAVFFNLFSEPEPVAAILTVHGTHVFWGSRETRIAEIQGRELGAVFWRGSESPPHQLGVWGNAESSPNRAPTANTFWTY